MKCIWYNHEWYISNKTDNLLYEIWKRKLLTSLTGIGCVFCLSARNWTPLFTSETGSLPYYAIESHRLITTYI